MQSNPLLLDTHEAARLLGLSTSFLEKARFYRDANGPPFLRVGRCVRYERAALERWIAERAEATE